MHVLSYFCVNFPIWGAARTDNYVAQRTLAGSIHRRQRAHYRVVPVQLKFESEGFLP